MSTIILLGSYIGLSDFIFDVQCNGSPIAESEARAMGLMDDNTARRHARSSYTRDWYRVKPGDQVQVHWQDDERNIKTTFVILTDLPNPPQSPDHESTGMRLYEYLKANCERVQ